MQPELVNTLIAICGPPCSGKSTIAGKLAASLNIVHLEADRIRSVILPDSMSSESDRDIAYRAMHLTAEYLLKAARSVILDATYGRTERRNDLKQLSIVTGARLLLIQCTVSPEVACARFLKRTRPHFAVDLDEQRVRLLAAEYRYDPRAFVLDTTMPVEECLCAVVSMLNAQCSGEGTGTRI